MFAFSFDTLIKNSYAKLVDTYESRVKIAESSAQKRIINDY